MATATLAAPMTIIDLVIKMDMEASDMPRRQLPSNRDQSPVFARCRQGDVYHKSSRRDNRKPQIPTLPDKLPRF